MVEIVQVIGTRPQYQKLIRFNTHDVVVDTGQHYSDSLVFDRPEVDYQLHWVGLRQVIRNIMRVIYINDPKVVIVYGDTFSTLCGAIAARKCGVPLVHIEAGVRTSAQNIEEKIRRKVDSLSTYWMCPTSNAYYESLKEVIPVSGRRSFFVGVLMYEHFLATLNSFKQGNIYILTLHRRENFSRLQELLSYVSKEAVKNNAYVWFFAHPNTLKVIQTQKITIPEKISIRDTEPNREMIQYLTHAKRVFTDSGGLVKEAYWSGCQVEFLGVNPWPEIHAFGTGYTSTSIKRIVGSILTGVNLNV